MEGVLLILVNLTVLVVVVAMCPSPAVVLTATIALSLIRTCTSLDTDMVSRLSVHTVNGGIYI